MNRQDWCHPNRQERALDSGSPLSTKPKITNEFADLICIARYLVGHPFIAFSRYQVPSPALSVSLHTFSEPARAKEDSSFTPAWNSSSRPSGVLEFFTELTRRSF